MTKLPYRPNQRIFLLSDQSTDKSALYNFFNISQSETSNYSLDISLVKLPNLNSSNSEDIVQIYSFPDDRTIKHYSEIYMSLLGRPQLIIYFVGVDSQVKEFSEWMHIMNAKVFKKHNGIEINSDSDRILDPQEENLHLMLKDNIKEGSNLQKRPRILFMSDVKTYSGRRQVIGKLSPYFTNDIVQHIYFVALEPQCLYNCFGNLGRVGIDMDCHITKISTFQKIRWAARKWIQDRKRPPTSVI